MDNSDEQSKITINGVEYDPSDAQSLIELGNRTREAEQKYNTKFDTVWPEYNRSQNRLRELETELKEARTQIEKNSTRSEGNPPVSSENLSPDQKEAARRLGVVFREDLDKSGYLTKDQARELFQQEQSQQKALEQETQRVVAQADELERKIDGSDGRPKFRKDLMMSYAWANKIPDLQEAYDRAFASEIESWKQAQVEASKKPSLKTLRTAGAKNPPDVRVTRDNVKDLMHEAIWGSNEE